MENNEFSTTNRGNPNKKDGSISFRLFYLAPWMKGYFIYYFNIPM
jgi:hypothetical protein